MQLARFADPAAQWGKRPLHRTEYCEKYKYFKLINGLKIIKHQVHRATDKL